MNNEKRKISICSYNISTDYEYNEYNKIKIVICYNDTELGYGEFSINIDSYKIDFEKVCKINMYRISNLEFNSYDEMIAYFLYSGRNCYFENLI